MKIVGMRVLIGVSVLAFLFLASPQLANAAPTEDQLISDLGSTDGGKVFNALFALEKKYPTTTKALPLMKNLLADSRPEVRRKAARVLGALHADLDEPQIKNICELLKSKERGEVIDGLKSLRGLAAPSAVPEILPLLKNADANIVRDSCRTLAVIGTKDVIPSIEPLLESGDPAIQKDAKDAIFALRSK